MSYTQTDAIIDWHRGVNDALNNEDSERLYELAQMVDDDEAQPLLDIIKNWNKSDWAYDESINN